MVDDLWRFCVNRCIPELKQGLVRTKIHVVTNIVLRFNELDNLGDTQDMQC